MPYDRHPTLQYRNDQDIVEPVMVNRHLLAEPWEYMGGEDNSAPLDPQELQKTIEQNKENMKRFEEKLAEGRAKRREERKAYRAALIKRYREEHDRKTKEIKERF